MPNNYFTSILNVYFLMVPFLPCDFTTFRVFFLMCFVSLLIFKFFSFVLYNVCKFYFNFYQKTKFSLQQHSKNMKNIRKNITLFKQTNLFWVVKTMFVHKENDVLIFFLLMFYCFDFAWCFLWFLYYFGFAILFLAFPSVMLLYKQKNDENKQTNKKQTNKKQTT